MLREPAISPDGRQLAFIAHGDIYLAPVAGGAARRLVDDPVHASKPRFGPRGDRIAFTRRRSGGGDVYVVTLDGAEESRLTFHSSEDLVESWSPDGKLVYFSSDRADISGYSDILAVPLGGGTPFAVSRARYEGEYNASVSPDGNWLAFNSNDRLRQWYRVGPRVDDATEVWIKPTDPGSNAFERITTFEGKDSWPLWEPTGRGVYVVTDEGSAVGAENLAFQGLDGERRSITAFDQGRLSWPTIAGDGTIAFERDFAIWTVRDGEPPRQVSITLGAGESAREPARAETVSRVSEFHAASSGERAAVVVNGDVFLYNLDSGGLVRVTNTAQPELDARLDPTGSRVAYVALRDGYFDVFVYDLATGQERRLTSTLETERNLRFSPDGSRLAFVAGADRIDAIDLHDGAIVEIASGLMMAPQLAWSPDGRLLAYVTSDTNWLSNVWLTRSDRRVLPVQLSDFPDVYFSGLHWPADSRTVLLGTWTTRESRQVASIAIPAGLEDAGDEGLRGFDLGPQVAYLMPANEALVLEAVDSEGKVALLSGESLGQAGLWRAQITDGGLRGFLPVASGRIDSAAVSDDGSMIYLSNGTLYRSEGEGSEPIAIKPQGRFEVEPSARRLALFRQAWLLIRDWMSPGPTGEEGLEQAYRHYEPFVRGAHNDFDFMIAVRMMLGSLDVGHSGVWGDPEVESEPVGDLGVDFDEAALREGRLVVAGIVRGSALRDSPLLVGDEIESVDDTRLGEGVNLHQLLLGRAGKPIAVQVQRGGQTIALQLSVHAPRDVAQFRYEEWVRHNRELVSALSAGRFTYVHRRHIGSGATEEFRRELGASALLRDGVVLDLRYNGGGIESTRAIGYLRRKVVHHNAFKDYVVAPGALVHGTPVLDRPVVLIQNEQGLSDSENFSHQFRRLGVGPVVGTRTAGGVRGRRGYRLFDGTSMAVGAWRTLTDDGEEMDRRGREPDLFVDRSLAETLEGVDSQLAAAVQALTAWIRDHEPPEKESKAGHGGQGSVSPDSSSSISQRRGHPRWNE